MRPTKTIVLSCFKTRKDEERNAIVSSKCKFCANEWMFYNATKMAHHLVSKCKNVPNDIKSALAASQGSSTSKSFVQDREAEEAEERALESSRDDGNIPSSKSKPSKRPLTMSQFLDRITDDEREKLHKLFSRAMVMSNLPFSTFATPEWEQFFNALRPAFDLPSEWNLRNSLLDNQYEEINNKLQDQINKTENVCILTDGYSNIRNEGIMAFIITTPAPLFYDMSLPGTEKENSEYVSQELSKIIENVGPEKVNGVCTDNAAVMKKTWEIIEEKYPHIVCYGCSPHTLNLLSKDISKLTSIKQLLRKSQNVVKAIKRSHVPLAIFTRKQKCAHGANAITLKLPGKTRWSGIEEMLNSLYKNRKELKETVIDSRVKFKDATIRTTVLDEEFWELVNSTRKLMRPIVKSIIYLEGDQRTVADVPHVLAILQKEISEVLEDWPLSAIDDVQQIEDFVEKRTAFGLKDVHFAANFLHPLHQGKVLPDHLRLRATKLISKMAAQLKLNVGEVLANAIQFQDKEGLWSDPDIFEAAGHLQPHAWWKGFCNNQPVAPIAIKLLQLPSSAAPVERLWSSFGLVHNKLRNRLKNSRTKKLVKIRWNILLSRRISTNKRSKKRKVVEANDSFSNASTYPLLKINNISQYEDESDEYGSTSSDSDMEERYGEEETDDEESSNCNDDTETEYETLSDSDSDD